MVLLEYLLHLYARDDFENLRERQLRYAVLAMIAPIGITFKPKEMMEAYVYDGGRGNSIDDAFSELPVIMPA